MSDARPGLDGDAGSEEWFGIPGIVQRQGLVEAVVHSGIPSQAAQNTIPSELLEMGTDGVLVLINHSV